MKTSFLITLMLLFAGARLHAQRSAFRSGYQRFGISTLGNNLDNSLSPKDNALAGNHGASTGFVTEFGHIFYFKSKKAANHINYGLDWTIFSASYNKLNKWNGYAAANNASNVTIDGTKASYAVSSKLGPVISFNPVEKLVIDVRLQVAPVLRVTDIAYYENEDETNEKSFTFYNFNAASDDVSKSFKDVSSFGVSTSFGISIRRKAIGLALDYTSLKANTNYDAYDGENNHSYGKVKMPYHSLQLKLSLSL